MDRTVKEKHQTSDKHISVSERTESVEFISRQISVWICAFCGPNIIYINIF